MTVPVSKSDGYDVSDPTDWLDTPLSSLMQVEQSLRCHVCKDFFNSPMITSCCHTFCSLCIRRALNTDGKCPLCRATDQESKLRGNWAIREAAEAFVNSRTAMLDLARRPATPATTPPKRKATVAAVEGESANKRTRMSTRSSSTRSAVNIATSVQDEASEPEVEEEDEYIPDDGLTPCPICLWKMKPEKVFGHLDTDCPGEPRPQPKPPSKSSRFGFAPTRSARTPANAHYDRLPSTNYSLLNETKLRKKLGEIGIPTWGTKVLMERRHREWVMIWNANCDSARPRTKRELLQDLDTWERTQGGNAPVSSTSVYQGAQVKDKDFDGAGWSTKHNDSFNDLIAQARRSNKKTAEKEKSQLLSSSAGNARAAEPIRGKKSTGGIEVPISMETEEVHHARIPVSSATTVDLTSPVRLNENGRIPGDEHISDEPTSVDTVVSSTLAGAHI